ncbi:MAG: hypothetical protein HPY74_05005 [Firmicutes bacterium]|nr:hypothetical protein [Bacillota bacterium]
MGMNCINRGILKVFVLILIAVMVFTLGFTGCIKSDTSGQTVEDTKSTGSTKFDKKLKITWIVYNQFDNPVKEGTETQKLIEERFNVELDIPELDVHSEDQWTVFWASGNTADRIQSNNMSKYFKKFADQGILRPITKDMLYKNAPNWMKAVESLIDPKVFMPQITYKGQVWAIPYTNMAQAKVSFVTAARKSYMDKVGITKPPETLDEYYNLIYKFTKDDPDGNGKNDTYGLHYQFGYVWGTFGIYPHSWYDINGKVTYTSTTEEYKEALKLLNKWYKEGLIDPEFVTDKRDIQRAKWAEGKLGMLEDHPWWFASSTPNNVSAMVLDKYPGEELVFFPAVKGPNGKSASYAYYPNVVNNAIYFGAETSDEKVERIMAIEDAIAADRDLYVRLWFGEKGKTYEVNEDGIIIPNKDLLTKEKISELGLMQTFALKPTTEEDFKKETLKSDMPPYETAFKNNRIYSGIVFPVDGINKAYNEKSADISSISQEFYFNAITGKIDIDAEWDAYIKKLNDAGLQEILKGFEEIIVR